MRRVGRRRLSPFGPTQSRRPEKLLRTSYSAHAETETTSRGRCCGHAVKAAYVKAEALCSAIAQMADVRAARRGTEAPCDRAAPC
ncbi:hypothetical protein NDU88_006475 [Pleurodeles waltl]|uniref:Uncharacterized protein n=1 Tax=Pleurodeles waltl TaxID=8319 RepID=A0AAV7QJ56_PLEWA|nr:hypothetical protein NDU88_006475 [Pleurodeles waltl]